jgi:hypothetical protein
VSQPLYRFGDDRQRDAGAPPEPAPTAAELFVREAYKDGNRVLRLRCVSRGSGYVVECAVRPVGSGQGDPPQLRAYAFADSHSATLFADEAARALEYLGCQVS